MFEVKNKANKEAEIFLFDEIGESFFGGISAKTFQEGLNSVKDASRITLHINSPGGSFFDGLAIYNMLRPYQNKLTASVEGLAASAASFVALAAGRVEMAEASWLMIHDAHAVVASNADGLREMAGTLDGFSKTIADIYSDKTKKTPDEMRAMMKKESWINAADAKAMGMIDAINKDLKVAASVDPKRFLNVPAALVATPKQVKNLQREKASAMVRRAGLL